MMQKGGINILDFDSKPKELRPGSRISQITDRKVCEHVYGVASELDVEFVYDKDFECELTFTYCPKCGKRLHGWY